LTIAIEEIVILQEYYDLKFDVFLTVHHSIDLFQVTNLMPVDSGLQSALNRHNVQPFTESDDTRCCNNKICPPEDEHSTARNMLRIMM